MKRFISLALALLMIFSLAACGQSEEAPASGNETEEAADGTQTAETTERTEPLVLRFGATGSGDEDDFQWLANREIIERVEEETNGMISFEYYPSSQLGDATSMFDQMLMGSLDMCVVQPNVAAAVWPEFNVQVFPFAYPDQQTYWDTMLSGGVFEAFRELTMADDRAVYLGVCSSNYRGCQNTLHPIRSADDFSDLKFRIQAGEIYVDIFAALGASTATINVSELYAALQQGVVNAEENPVAFCYDNSIYEQIKYATELNAVNSTAQIFMSTNTWNKLTAEEQEIFINACREEPVVAMTEANEKIDEYYDLFEEAGIEVVRNEELTDEERQSFIDAEMPIWDKYKEAMDQDFYSMWYDSLKAAWEKNGYAWTLD